MVTFLFLLLYRIMHFPFKNIFFSYNQYHSNKRYCEWAKVYYYIALLLKVDTITCLVELNRIKNDGTEGRRFTMEKKNVVLKIFMLKK